MESLEKQTFQDFELLVEVGLGGFKDEVQQG